MAREYARIRISIAGDDDVADLSVHAQWLYFRVLIAESTLSHCGVADWRPQRLLGKAAGVTLPDVLAAAAELEQARFALFSPDTEEVLVRSYIRSEELLRNPKMAVAVRDAYLAVASRPLKAAIVAEVIRDRAEHPDYSSWTHSISRAAVEALLTAKGPDQVPYVTAFPNRNGNRNGNHEGVQNGNHIGNVEQVPNTDPDPGADWVCESGPDSLHLAPTSLLPAPTGGREHTQLTEAGPPDGDPPPPSRFCPKHPAGTDRPCLDCKRARQEFDRAELAAAEAVRAEESDARLQAAIAQAQAIVECERCDDDGYVGGQVCAHREHATAEARAAARAKVAAAIAKGGAS